MIYRLLFCFLLLFSSLFAHDFFNEFDRLKSQNWKALCKSGEEALKEKNLPLDEKACIHARLASSYFYLGDYKTMKKHVQACKVAALDSASKEALVTSLYLFSAYERAREAFDEAQKVIDQALALIDNTLSSKITGKVFFNAGAAHADDPTGDLFQAKTYYMQALDYFEFDSDDSHRTVIRLAKCLLLLNEAKQAKNLLLPLFEKELTPRTEVHLYYVAAQLFLFQKEMEKAMTCIQKGITQATTLKMKKDEERFKILQKKMDQCPSSLSS